jgi:tRNA pseudouridine38-40 synthase
VQPDRFTIQGELSDAIERITGERVLPQGSGRTDAGVHARGQVASFFLHAGIPEANLLRALNRTLPESIRALSAQHASSDFHARHSAQAKTYEYRIYRAEVCPPWIARFAWALHWPLDLMRMQAAAELVIGTHDFSSFAASDPDLASRNSAETSNAPRVEGTIRTLYMSQWSEESDLFIYRVRGNGFLHHMVRNLVGTFVDVGRGHIGPEELHSILAARSRSAAGATAPARGLFLDSVEY